MALGSTRSRAMVGLIWIVVLTAIFLWGRNLFQPPGWDLRVYQTAMESLRAGHDPYADGIAVQRAFHARHITDPAIQTPFTYVYSPLTLLPLRLLAKLPARALSAVYWLLYTFGALTILWVGLQFAEPRERRALTLLAPLTLLFPGLLITYAIYSGNLAYILYALVLSTALLGWRRDRWLWFYLAVLLTSCLKAPLLILIAIPLFSARRQLIPAASTGLAGLALFALQPLLWPTLFHSYLTAVELQFSYNHDFSASPAGLLADALYSTIPYTVTSVFFYLFYALPVAAILFHLSRRFLRGQFSLARWAPVLLLGVTLLNPRIMEYDIAAITLPMALIAWRFLSRGQTLPRAAAILALLLPVWNLECLGNWRPGGCMMLVVLFALGVWDLYTIPPAPSETYHRDEQLVPEAQTYA